MSVMLKKDVAETLGVSQKEADRILRVLSELISIHLALGSDVRLFGLGRFLVKESKPRIGRDKTNGYKSVSIPARKTVKFRPASILLDSIR